MDLVSVLHVLMDGPTGSNPNQYIYMCIEMEMESKESLDTKGRSDGLARG